MAAPNQSGLWNGCLGSGLDGLGDCAERLDVEACFCGDLKNLFMRLEDPSSTRQQPSSPKMADGIAESELLERSS
jgi:hypothetical protein